MCIRDRKSAVDLNYIHIKKESKKRSKKTPYYAFNTFIRKTKPMKNDLLFIFPLPVKYPDLHSPETVSRPQVRTIWSVPVSYTHLFRRRRFQRPLMGAERKNRPGAVSYTHLDVYKRQLLPAIPPLFLKWKTASMKKGLQLG